MRKVNSDPVQKKLKYGSVIVKYEYKHEIKIFENHSNVVVVANKYELCIELQRKKPFAQISFN